jgi:two-component system catabolic regulation response regulator CreB
LTARVKAILKRTSVTDDGRATTNCDFEIDTARCRIRYIGEWLDLTHYEYLLLRVLLQHPERIYSRSEIMDRVWPDPGDSLERAVDTHIKTLRAKLRNISDQESPIKTHRGLGYSISGSVCEA